MKLLLTADAFGDSLKNALELCQAFDGADVTVVLALFGPSLTGAQRRQLAALANVELHECATPLTLTSLAAPAFETATDWLLALIEKLRPDVVHLGHPELGAAAGDLPLLVAAHDCPYVRWRALHDSMPPRAWDRHRHAVQSGLRRARRVVVPNRATLAALERVHGGLPQACVIPVGLSPGAFHAARKELFVLAVGDASDETRNLQLLVRAEPSIRVPVRFADSRLPAATLAYWYGRAALFVLPARHEAFGIAVVEAALSRCAPILGDVPPLRETWGDDARYVPSNDPYALADAVNDLAARPAARQDLARRAELRARALSPEHGAAAYLELYRSLLTEGASARAARRARSAESLLSRS